MNEGDCVSIIRNFLSDKLKLDPTPIHIQRAHRLGKPVPQNRRWAKVTAGQRGPRPIIVCFRDYNDVELIMSNANKLRGTSYGINRDYPRKIINARSKLWADYKTAKDINPSHKVSISDYKWESDEGRVS